MEQGKNVKNKINLSMPFFLLSLFTISNYFSPLYYLGDNFSRLPLILVISAAASYLLVQIVKGKRLLALSPATFCLTIVYIFAVVSTYFFSVDINHSEEFLDHFTKSVSIYFLISHILTNQQELKAYLIVLACSTFGIAYKLVNFPVWSEGRASVGGSYFISDPNDITAVIVYIIPIVGALILLIRSKLFQLLFIYIIFILLLGIAEAQSRGGFLAFIVMIGVWLTQIDNSRFRRWVILLLIPFTILFAYRYVDKNYFYRMYEILSPESDPTGSAVHRKTAMSIAFDYILFHPISEYGLGNHSYLIAKEYGESPSQASGSQDIFRGKFLAHNFLLQFGADTGLVPLIFYLLFIFYLYHTLHHDQKILVTINTIESKELIIISKALRIGLCGLLVSAFFLPWAYRFYLFYVGGLCTGVHILTKELALRTAMVSD